MSEHRSPADPKFWSTESVSTTNRCQENKHPEISGGATRLLRQVEGEDDGNEEGDEEEGDDGGEGGVGTCEACGDTPCSCSGICMHCMIGLSGPPADITIKDAVCDNCWGDAGLCETCNKRMIDGEDECPHCTAEDDVDEEEEEDEDEDEDEEDIDSGEDEEEDYGGDEEPSLKRGRTE